MIYFVGGYARTGSTLLTGLMCNDPTTNPPIGEVAYLEYMMIPFDIVNQTWAHSHKGQFDTEEEFLKVHGDALKVYIDHLFEKHQCENLVIKRPFIATWFPVFAEMFPESRYVVCIRDPRDTIGDLKRTQHLHRKKDLKERELNPFLEQSLADFSYGYVEAVRSCLAGARTYRDRYTFVKYEDLCSDPDRAMKNISEEIGLELGQKAWTDLEGAFKGQLDSAYYSPDWGKPITDKYIGQYKKQLALDEIEMVELICQSMMEAFGYE